MVTIETAWGDGGGRNQGGNGHQGCFHDQESKQEDQSVAKGKQAHLTIHTLSHTH